ncbi:MAG: TraX protein [Oscillospiraceae bacterium]|nr:TraX protein [Oscillospiraceae bacterium]
MQKSIFPDKYRILSGSMLKLIAMISMLIDHTAFILAPVLPYMVTPLLTFAGREITLYWIMRKIGRIAFPIFCFLITEGYTHTRNKFKYGLNLLIFAIISEIPFNLVFNRFFIFKYQNVFFTLFLGLLLIYILESVSNQFKKAILMGIVVVISMYINCDYGFKGVLLILLIYLLKNNPVPQAILSYPLLSGGLAALTAFLPINLYSGKRGFIKSNTLKYGFYLFYPIHIVILVIIKTILK